MKTYRILRVLEYIGTREWLDVAINNRTVKGQRSCGSRGTIREAIIGETPELLDVCEVAEALEDKGEKAEN